VLEPFWASQKQEISQASTDLAEYKSQQLPLARIKKVGVVCLSRPLACSTPMQLCHGPPLFDRQSTAPGLRPHCMTQQNNSTATTATC
jgi:hypothetical protein